jgi:integron integrase
MNDIPTPIPANPERFMDKFRAFVRVSRLSYKTEQTYCHWVISFIKYHNKQHPETLSNEHINEFLNHLSLNRQVAINTQKTALNALVFLYAKFFGRDVGKLDFQNASKPRRIPTVFSHAEAMKVLELVAHQYKLISSLMYGSGLRVMEACRLRVQDVDFSNRCLIVREAKGLYWRRTLLPNQLVDPLKAQIEFVLSQHRRDITAGFGSVYLPDALGRKYPKAHLEPAWQYLFPAKNYSIDPRSGIKRRHHVSEKSVQRSVKQAIQEAMIFKKAGCHTFRHSFATNLLKAGTDRLFAPAKSAYITSL